MSSGRWLKRFCCCNAVNFFREKIVEASSQKFVGQNLRSIYKFITDITSIIDSFKMNLVQNFF